MDEDDEEPVKKPAQRRALPKESRKVNKEATSKQGGDSPKPNLFAPKKGNSKVKPKKTATKAQAAASTPEEIDSFDEQEASDQNIGSSKPNLKTLLDKERKR